MSTDEPNAAPELCCDTLLCFWRDELAKAESALCARIEAKKTWAGGTAESWREAGCKMTKAQRIKISDREGRIAEKCQKRVEAIKATIELLSQNDLAHTQEGRERGPENQKD